jgi:hypothetical protein
MESTAFFEKKISLTPSDFNEVKTTPIEEILLRKAREGVENKCSEQGFVLPGSLQLLSRSMGYFESARFTGEAIYYVKLEGKVVYPVEGVQVLGKVIRKNKMGLYINYNDAIRIQVPRDLHLDRPEFEDIQVGETVEVELKRSKFAIYDAYILASGMFLSVVSDRPIRPFVENEREEKPVAEQIDAASEAASESAAASASEASQPLPRTPPTCHAFRTQTDSRPSEATGLYHHRCSASQSQRRHGISGQTSTVDRHVHLSARTSNAAPLENLQ